MRISTRQLALLLIFIFAAGVAVLNSRREPCLIQEVGNRERTGFTTVNRILRVGDEVQKKILKLVNSKPLMTDMNEPRPDFIFILEPRKTIQSLKEQIDEVRWTAVNMVKSSISNRDRRDTIRKTWGSMKEWKGVQIATIFILGNTSSHAVQEEVEREFNAFGDVLQINSEDNYKNVPYKTLAGMQWARENLPSNWLYSSGDDDVALHVPNFVRFIDKSSKTRFPIYMPLHKRIEHLPIICMYAYSPRDQPARYPGSKWYMSRKQYSLKYWPPYCRGGWYSIPVFTVDQLYSVSRYTRFLRLDDVWITGIMRIKLLAIREVPREYLLNAMMLPAPVSIRSDWELRNNAGGYNLTQVIASHVWGNIKENEVNVPESLLDIWKIWNLTPSS